MRMLTTATMFTRALGITSVSMLALLLMASTVSAQGQTDGARPLGMGSAFIANASGNGALYHNPAGIGTSLMYAFEGSYLYQPEINAFNASVVDSKLNPSLSAGLAYSYEQSSTDEFDLTGHDARLALASQIIPQQFVLGAGLRYLNFELDDEGLIDGFTFDLGTIFRLTDGVFVGLSGSNLVDVCSGDEGCPTESAPRLVGGGLALGSTVGLQVSGDARADLTDKDDVQWLFAGGAEYLAMGLLALRAGYQHQTREGNNIIAGGLGFRSHTVGLDVGYQYAIEPNESRAVIGLQLYLFN